MELFVSSKQEVKEGWKGQFECLVNEETSGKIIVSHFTLKQYSRSYSEQNKKKKEENFYSFFLVYIFLLQGRFLRFILT